MEIKLRNAMNVKDCIFFQLTKASQADAGFWSKRVAHLNITGAQAMVLNFLSEEDQIPSHILGEKLKITSATMTGILDRLEKLSLIERRANPDDRRAILVCLTDKGATFAAELRELFVEANREFLAQFRPEEESFFRELLKRLA